jgi:hypothetical protein
MSDKPEARDVQGEHPIDTPEQSAARQLIDTTARVTHVATVSEGEPVDDFSLHALVVRKPAETKVTVTRTGPQTATVTKKGD